MKFCFLILLILSACATTPRSYERKIDAKTLKLCFIGDTGSHDQHQKDVADLLLKENCDSVHFVGDIIYPSGIYNEKDPEFKKRFWNYYENVAKKGKKPILNVVLGNHDHKRSVSAWEKIPSEYPEVFFPNPWYMVRINEVCLVHTDTDYYRFFSNYYKASQQMKWLESLDHELKDCSLKIALGHHPYNSSGEDHGNSSGRMREILFKTIIGKYDYYIAGHEHILSDEGVINGTRLLISGAGGQRDYKVGGFLVMEVTGKESKYYFKKSPE